MINKQGLLDLIARAERGALLDGEAAILRDAIELLDELAMIVNGEDRGRLKITGYDASTTQSFRVIGPSLDNV